MNPPPALEQLARETAEKVARILDTSFEEKRVDIDVGAAPILAFYESARQAEHGGVKADPTDTAIAGLSPGMRNIVECLATELNRNVGHENITAEMVSTPAMCSKCGQKWNAPTTGKMLNICPTCGGKLAPLLSGQAEHKPAGEEYSKTLDVYVYRLGQEFDRHSGNPVRRELAWRNVLKEFAQAIAPFVAQNEDSERPNWEEMGDADLNRQFARAFWDCPIDERNNTYWHDDDKTPEDENHEWKPLPNFCNDWSAVRKLLVNSSYILPIHHGAPQDQHSRCRRAMVNMLILAHEKGGAK